MFAKICLWRNFTTNRLFVLLSADVKILIDYDNLYQKNFQVILEGFLDPKKTGKYILYCQVKLFDIIECIVKSIVYLLITLRVKNLFWYLLYLVNKLFVRIN